VIIITFLKRSNMARKRKSGNNKSLEALPPLPSLLKTPPIEEPLFEEPLFEEPSTPGEESLSPPPQQQHRRQGRKRNRIHAIFMEDSESAMVASSSRNDTGDLFPLNSLVTAATATGGSSSLWPLQLQQRKASQQTSREEAGSAVVMTSSRNMDDKPFPWNSFSTSAMTSETSSSLLPLPQQQKLLQHIASQRVSTVETGSIVVASASQYDDPPDMPWNYFSTAEVASEAPSSPLPQEQEQLNAQKRRQSQRTAVEEAEDEGTVAIHKESPGDDGPAGVGNDFSIAGVASGKVNPSSHVAPTDPAVAAAVPRLLVQPVPELEEEALFHEYSVRSLTKRNTKLLAELSQVRCVVKDRGYESWVSLFCDSKITCFLVSLLGWANRPPNEICQYVHIRSQRQVLEKRQHELLKRKAILDAARTQHLSLQQELQESLSRSRERLARLVKLGNDEAAEERSAADAEGGAFSIRQDVAGKESQDDHIGAMSQLENTGANASGRKLVFSTPLVVIALEKDVLEEFGKRHRPENLLNFLLCIGSSGKTNDGSLVEKLMTISIREASALDLEDTKIRRLSSTMGDQVSRRTVQRHHRRESLWNTCLDFIQLGSTKRKLEQNPVPEQREYNNDMSIDPFGLPERRYPMDSPIDERKRSRAEAQSKDIHSSRLDPNFSLCPYELAGGTTHKSATFGSSNSYSHDAFSPSFSFPFKLRSLC
jgi:hypothetical protein